VGSVTPVSAVRLPSRMVFRETRGMSIAYLVRSLPIVCFLALTAAACSSNSMQTSPDAQAGVDSAADASIASPPDSAVLDGGGENQGEAGVATRLTVSPASIDVGSIPPGVASPKQTITVTALSDIPDLKVILSSGDLTLDATSTCASTLVAGARCVVVFTFLSSTTGTKNDSVTIVAGDQSTVVLVTAKVLSGDFSINPSTQQTFSHVCPGETSAPITFYVPNASDTAWGPLTLEITGTDALDFTATATGCDVIAPGAACAIAVAFAPRIDYVYETASLLVIGPAPDFPAATVSLIGFFGSVPNPLTLTPPSGELGSVAVGTTGPSVTFTLSYDPFCPGEPGGPFTVTVTSLEFVVTGETCSTSVLPAGGTCTVSVALRPASAGPKTATLVATPPGDNAGVKTLTGTGVDAATDASVGDAPQDPGLDVGSEV
jgi:hypothetical protein